MFKSAAKKKFEPCARYAVGGVEPSLHDLLNDPLTHAIMRRDNLTANDVQSVLDSARANLAA